MTVDSIELYTAPWCAPCKVFKPKLEALTTERLIPLTIKDIEQEVDPNVKSVPTTVLRFRNGQVSYVAGANIDMIDTILSESVR